MTREQTVDEMVTEAEEHEPAGLRDQLDAITGSVSEDGVSVTVDLHGKLIGLTLDQHVMTSRPTELAARVQRLAAFAATDALAAGMAVLADVLDADVLDVSEPEPASPSASG